MFWRWLRGIAWWIIKKTDKPGIPHIVLTHDCGSDIVYAFGNHFGDAKDHYFECLGCMCLTESTAVVKARLVDPYDEDIIRQQKEGSIVLHPLY